MKNGVIHRELNRSYYFVRTYDYPVTLTVCPNGRVIVIHRPTAFDTLEIEDAETVLDYVGRYTHRVAISNNRLLDIEAGQVHFRYKDYRDQGQPKTMALSADEFIRRFLLHALPDGFQRIRYYGFLGNRYRQEKLARCRQLLGMPPAAESYEPSQDYRDRHEELTGTSLRECPVCHRGRMFTVETLAAQRSSVIQDTS